MALIQSWGRVGSYKHQIHSISDTASAHHAILNFKPGLAYGMGRSYGDVCLNPQGHLWKTQDFNRFIAFDASKGILKCDSGVLLGEIQRFFIPQGWMLPVSPGTQIVTVGGAIANDIHGKNHHVFGSFGNNLNSFKLLRTNGESLECSLEKNSDLFRATIGGLGLTGFILEASIKLRPVSSPYLMTQSMAFYNLDEFFNLADSSEATWEYTVAWIDCVQKKPRGIFMRANHDSSSILAEKKRKNITIPFVMPFSMISNLTLRPFNWLYFNLKNKRKLDSLEHYQSFFYPLDAIHGWSKLYGPKGFYQHQSVFPDSNRKELISSMISSIAQSGQGSPLAVLKTFGAMNSVGMLSFPKKGVTLALDFPNKGSSTLKLFKRLDAIVKEAGGRIYPAKDQLMSPELFKSAYPALSTFNSFRDLGIKSAFSCRIMEN